MQAYAKRIEQAPRLGILTIGGGVPRNWAQQVGPYFDIMNHRLGTEFRIPRFQYGVRICPEPVHWGGLSGCTYSEGVSWGKFVPPSEGGRYAEIYADATVALPLLMKAIFETLDPSRWTRQRPIVARVARLWRLFCANSGEFGYDFPESCGQSCSRSTSELALP